MSLQVEIEELYSSFFVKSARRLKKHQMPNQDYPIKRKARIKHELRWYERGPLP